MKKTDIALIIGVIVIIVIGVFVMKGQKDKVSYELPLTLKGETGLHELTYSEYEDKINNNEEFVLIVERKTCSHCVNYMPVAEEFAKKNEVPMYYIDTDTFTQDEWSKLSTSNTFFKKNGESWGTPTTIVLAGKTAVDQIEGETDESTLIKLYEKYFDYKKRND